MPGVKSYTTAWAMGVIVLVMLCGVTAFAEERFTDNGNGTVTDHKLRLMWSQSDNEGDIGWKDGYRWVKYNFHYFLPGNKFDDWRMPTIKELKSLYVVDKKSDGEISNCGMKVKIIPQVSLSCGWVWSSESTKMSAKVFSFKLGTFFSDLKMQKKAHRVLAVRDIRE